MIYKRVLIMVFACLWCVLGTSTQGHGQLVLPSLNPLELIGERFADKPLHDAYTRVYEDLKKGGPQQYLNALKQHEQKLRELQQKHVTQRQKEESDLQRLIDGMNRDMVSYSREDAGRGTVGQRQAEKQQEWSKRINDYAKSCRDNESRRANEVQELQRQYPRMTTY